MLTRLSTRQAHHIEHMKLNNENMRAKLKIYKDRERRDQEHAEQLAREAQELEDQNNGIPHQGRLKGKSGFSLGKRSGTGVDSDADSNFDENFNGEAPTYKKAIREQYEKAINNYAQDSEFYKKNF